MKLYLSGPMSNYPQFNIPAFERAAESLRALGHEVIVPYELDNDDGVGGAARASENGDVAAFTALTGFTWGDLLARDIKLIADGKIEGIVVLPDWENSKGARLEAYIGLSANLPIFICWLPGSQC